MQTTYVHTLLIAQKLLQEQIVYSNSEIMNQRPSIPDQIVPVGYRTDGSLRKLNTSGIQQYGTNYYDPLTPTIKHD